jgi:hypothetical protein
MASRHKMRSSWGSIVEDLKQRQTPDAVFATKNWKDFGTPNIIANLSEWSCKLADSFSDALRPINP